VRHRDALVVVVDLVGADPGDRAGQSAALNHIRWILAQLGDLHQTLAHCREALGLAQETADSTDRPTSGTTSATSGTPRSRNPGCSAI